MKKILCPTDFSDAAHNAIAYAAKFAQQTGSELVLFNIQSLFALSPGELLSKTPKSLEKVRTSLENQAKEVTAAFKVHCSSELQVSDDRLSSVIATHAGDFDLIIMGTNGPDDLYQFFFGTNTYNVLKNSGVPLLFVPDMVRFTNIGRIVFAYDYLHLGVPPLKQFKEWMQHFDAEVKFLQLIKRPLNEDEHVVKARHQVEINYELSDDFAVSFDEDTSTAFRDSIQHYMLKTDSDLLVLCTKPYSLAEKLFHKSLSKKIAMDFMYPSLIVHE